MRTQKSKEEINFLLSQSIDKEFNTRKDLASFLQIHPVTLNTWVDISDYTFDELLSKKRSLRTQIENLGGLSYLESQFKKGFLVKDIAEELDAKSDYTDEIINRMLKEKGITKKDIGYKKYSDTKQDEMYRLIDEKGGIAYLLECKEKNMDVNDIADEIGGDMIRQYIASYLKEYGLIFTNLHSYKNVYYIHHLCKWRGSFINEGVVYDTRLYDNIWEALKQVEKIRGLKED